MSTHIVKVLETGFITHNVKRFVVEKPAGYTFISGQATDVAINQPALKDELRPFTFTSVNQGGHLEFMIKIYKGHDGITEKLETINTGDELILHDVFGAITYKGPGLFIAAGAGITPFVSIFRQLKLQDQLAGNTLLFANRTPEDVILKDELKSMLAGKHIDVIEKTADNPAAGKHIDRDLLKKYLLPENKYYYICGPDKFVADMSDHLIALGINKSQIVIEE